MTYTKYYLLFNDRCATLVDYKKLFFNTVIAKGLYTIKALVRDQLGMFCGSIAGAHKTDRATSMFLCHGVYFRTIVTRIENMTHTGQLTMFLFLPLNDALFSIFIPYILQMNAFLERVQLPISRKNCFKIPSKDKPVRENAV